MNNTTYLVSLTEDEIKLITNCLNYSNLKVFSKGDNYPILNRVSKELATRLDSTITDYWTTDGVAI